MIPRRYLLSFELGGQSPNDALQQGLQPTGWRLGAPVGPARQGLLRVGALGSSMGVVAFSQDGWPGRPWGLLVPQISTTLQRRVGLWTFNDDGFDYDEWQAGVHQLSYSTECEPVLEGPAPPEQTSLERAIASGRDGWRVIEARWEVSVPRVTCEEGDYPLPAEETVYREPVPWSDDPKATDLGDELHREMMEALSTTGEYVVRGFGMLRAHPSGVSFRSARDLRRIKEGGVPNVSHPILHRALKCLVETGHDVAIGRRLVLWRQRIADPIPRRGRNPQTGEPLLIPPRLVVGLEVQR